MTNLIKILNFIVTLSFINEVYTKDFLKEAEDINKQNVDKAVQHD